MMTSGHDILTGGCQCGAVRYELSAPPSRVYICHCTECRRQSSSAFGISVIADVESFRLTEGEAACWTRATSGGGEMDCFFCGNCGARLWHRVRGEDVISVKGGSLDHPVDISDVPHIWTRSKLAGVIIPDHVTQAPKEPA
ncbi:MAG: GFA family protein [Geminicoccaceae bacterium]